MYSYTTIVKDIDKKLRGQRTQYTGKKTTTENKTKKQNLKMVVDAYELK